MMNTICFATLVAICVVNIILVYCDYIKPPVNFYLYAWLYFSNILTALCLLLLIIKEIDK
mgnify:CR=1 FL=1